MKNLHSNNLAKYIHRSLTDQDLEFRIWFGISLQTIRTPHGYDMPIWITRQMVSMQACKVREIVWMIDFLF